MGLDTNPQLGERDQKNYCLLIIKNPSRTLQLIESRGGWGNIRGIHDLPVRFPTNQISVSEMERDDLHKCQMLHLISKNTVLLKTNFPNGYLLVLSIDHCHVPCAQQVVPHLEHPAPSWHQRGHYVLVAPPVGVKTLREWHSDWKKKPAVWQRLHHPTWVIKIHSRHQE